LCCVTDFLSDDISEAARVPRQSVDLHPFDPEIRSDQLHRSEDHSVRLGIQQMDLSSEEPARDQQHTQSPVTTADQQAPDDEAMDQCKFYTIYESINSGTSGTCGDVGKERRADWSD